MSAAARAEARRKAILSRGNDRLAKLTTSGRGDDPAYAKEATPDPPLPEFPTSATNTSNFVGEVTANMPRPRSRVPSQVSVNGGNSRGSSPFNAPDPSSWSEEQQAQFLQALMGGAPPAFANGAASPAPENPFTGMEGNPLAALMAGAGVGGAGAGFPPFGAGMGTSTAMGKTPDVAPPQTRLQRLLPVIHFLAVWTLIAYFVLFREPVYYVARYAATGGAEEANAAWRWKQLAGANGPREWGVQAVPFFWGFVTLQLVLHSLRIFSGFDTFRPPTLLALALPHLPSPIPSVIVHSMKYLQMGSSFLDDISALLVGIGFVVWLATWFAT